MCLCYCGSCNRKIPDPEPSTTRLRLQNYPTQTPKLPDLAPETMALFGQKHHGFELETPMVEVDD